MNYEKLISTKNLELAWRRITTGKNISYKKFFRHLYLAYELGLNENLKHLNQRLKGSWRPQKPIRIYLPKPSGLQRPVSLLSIEDQIVLQAIANRLSLKIYPKRKNLENKVVFSNILNTPSDTIFFLKDWRNSYNRYQARSIDYFKKGNPWIAHFDLAAFYDTISHRLVMKAVAPRGGHSGFWIKIQKWLQCWSTASNSLFIDHGIPQGPLASDFIAECFLISLDEQLMKENINYIRYVDDIRIFADSQLNAQKAAVKLEIICRNLGLIPQGKKFAISHIKAIDEPFLYSLPSIPHDEPDIKDTNEFDTKTAERLFSSSMSGRPCKITDKSKARFVLFRAQKSNKILKKVITLLPKHPEHIDAFCAYLQNYKKSKGLEKIIKQMLNESVPYDYVRGLLWETLTRIATGETYKEMLPLARNELKKSDGCIILKNGVIIFLLKCQSLHLTSYSKRIKYESPLVQSFLIPFLPDHEYQKNRLVGDILNSKAIEPLMVLGEQLSIRNQSLKDYGLTSKNLPNIVGNIWRGTGIIRRRFSKKVDVIGELLQNKYNINKSGIWRVLLGTEYTHALQILLKAEAIYASGRSNWMQEQNSFNDLICRALIKFMKTRNLPGGGNRLTSLNSTRIIKFGVLLDINQDFGRNHPNIATPMRNFNNRRNSLPGSHPYEVQSGTKTIYLTWKEQGRYAGQLSNLYSEIIILIESVI